MTEIAPHLHQSDVDYAREHGHEYDAILNVGCKKSIGQPQIIMKGQEPLAVYHIALYEYSVSEDTPDLIYQPDSLLIAVVDLLDDLLKQGKKVLVHCDAGMVRSVGICAAWQKKSGLIEKFTDGLWSKPEHVNQNTLFRQLSRIYQ